MDKRPITSTPRRPVGVPRQYGVGTLLLITAMYAVVFSFLRCLHAPVVIFAIVAAFLTCIGLGQMLLFKGKAPRAGSIVAGALFCGLPAIALNGWSLFEHGSLLYAEDALLSVAVAFVFGGGLGYCTGVAIAIVFLGAETLKSRLSARRLRIMEENNAEDES